MIKHIKGRNPTAPLFSVSYSLGSSMLGKYMGEEGEKSLVDGAMCLATPLDILLSSRLLLDSVEGRMINPVLVTFPQGVIKENMMALMEKDPRFDLDKVMNANTMNAFDECFTVPMFSSTGGSFQCASDYHREASCARFLHYIRKPTLFIHAANDPLAPGTLWFRDVFAANPFLIHCNTLEGAHGMVRPHAFYFIYYLCSPPHACGHISTPYLNLNSQSHRPFLYVLLSRIGGRD